MIQFECAVIYLISFALAPPRELRLLLRIVFVTRGRLQLVLNPGAIKSGGRSISIRGCKLALLGLASASPKSVP